MGRLKVIIYTTFKNMLEMEGKTLEVGRRVSESVNLFSDPHSGAECGGNAPKRWMPTAVKIEEEEEQPSASEHLFFVAFDVHVFCFLCVFIAVSCKPEMEFTFSLIAQFAYISCVYCGKSVIQCVLMYDFFSGGWTTFCDLFIFSPAGIIRGHFCHCDLSMRIIKRQNG